MILIITTVPDAISGKKLARSLVEKRLAACVQIMPQMTSVYSWEGKVEEESEYLLLIKTLSEKQDEIEAFINSEHSYDTPEIVTFEAARISEKYSEWLTGYLLKA